jgi:hypothetical protein
MAKRKEQEIWSANIERALARPPQPRINAQTTRVLIEEYRPRPTGNASATSRTNVVCHTNDETDGVPMVSHTNMVCHTNMGDLWASVPVTQGHTRLWHAITDHLFRHLDPAEQAVYLQLFRLSWGWGKDNCFINLDHLAERANVSRMTASRALGRLVARKLVERTERVQGRGRAQGTSYRLPLPAWCTRMVSHTSSVPNKEKDSKEEIEKGAVRAEPQYCAACQGTGWRTVVRAGQTGVVRCQHTE